jgi:hypothetical protein
MLPFLVCQIDRSTYRTVQKHGTAEGVFRIRGQALLNHRAWLCSIPARGASKALAGAAGWCRGIVRGDLVL